MNDQMIRVISSPSSSTTGFFTLILAMCRPWGVSERWRSGRRRAGDAIAGGRTGGRTPRARATLRADTAASEPIAGGSGSATGAGDTAARAAGYPVPDGHRCPGQRPARAARRGSTHAVLQPAAAAGGPRRLLRQHAPGRGDRARGRPLGARARERAGRADRRRAAAPVGPAGEREQAGAAHARPLRATASTRSSSTPPGTS